MRIVWLGHASFLIETGNARIITDPFDEPTGYRIPNIAADLVTISHHHHDHNTVDWVWGSPRVISAPGKSQFREIEVFGIKSFHDHQEGRLRGDNTIFVIKAEGLAVCHLGDLGHMLDPDQIKAIGKVDVLMVPVGGTYTISGSEAVKIAASIKPRVTVPMHFKTPPCTIDLAPADDFTRHYERIVKLPYLELTAREENLLPEVVVLDYSYIDH